MEKVWKGKEIKVGLKRMKVEEIEIKMGRDRKKRGGEKKFEGKDGKMYKRRRRRKFNRGRGSK